VRPVEGDHPVQAADATGRPRIARPMSSRRISVVVPVYNSEAMLEELVARIHAALDDDRVEFELILVDDGSSDGSWQKIRELAAGRPWLCGLKLRRNFGQHAATLAGVRDARYELIATLDDDLQNPPEELPRLLEAAAGHDVVYGTTRDPQHGFLRGAATWITKRALQASMGKEVARNVSPYRVFRTDLRDAFADFRGPFVSIDVLLAWCTSSFAAVPVGHAPRAAGSSNYRIRDLVRHALNMATGFSTWPLQVASIIGFVFALLGVLVLVYVGVRRIVDGNPVPGFPFLASVIALFAGAQLFAIGIIGEYLARMYFRVMDKTTYAIGERVGGPE
jgi:glycosyltransferase involved in cell wall biosynthesis